MLKSEDLPIKKITETVLSGNRLGIDEIISLLPEDFEVNPKKGTNYLEEYLRNYKNSVE